MQPDTATRYFRFTRRERRGIYLLLALIAAVFTVPAFFPLLFPQHTPPVPEAEIQQLLATLQPALPEEETDDHENNRYRSGSGHRFTPAAAAPVNGPLFYFDPNTLSPEGWEKLGVSPRTTQTIQHYLQKGGRFRNPEDLARIYGMPPALAEKLLPYVQINAQTGRTPNRYPAAQNFPANYPNANTQKTKTMMNVNVADTSEWKLLPGIGSGYARRIVSFREKLGGFYSVEQVGETRGLPDSVFQHIKNRLVCDPAQVRTQNLNAVSAEALATHPYISKNLANGIVQYRNQHGPYRSVADLRALDLITEAIYLKINNYFRTAD